MRARCAPGTGTRSGATLVEAIVAIALIGMVGLGGVGLVRSAAGSLTTASNAEHELRDADRFLGAVTLWSRAELDQRLGDREQGDWRLEIQQVQRTLYLLTLRDRAGERLIIQTSLFRPEGVNAER